MKALVLAAGKGTRLARVSAGLPKPLVDVCGTTPLEHALSWVAAMRPAHIWINVHDAAQLVQQRIGTEVAGVPVHYSFEPELLGTAGAWKKLESEWTETSLVVYGDNFMHFDLSALREHHRAAGGLMTIALFDPDRHANTGKGGGRVELRDGRVQSFVEGGEEGLINAGAYFIEPELSARLGTGFVDFGHDVMPGLAASGELAGHVVEDAGYCLGVDTPERLSIARELVRSMEVSQ